MQTKGLGKIKCIAMMGTEREHGSPSLYCKLEGPSITDWIVVSMIRPLYDVQGP